MDIGRRKALALLAYLATTGQAQSRDTLALLFWPEAPQRNARANLRRALSDLNREIGSGRLVLAGEIVSLADDDKLWCDVARFRSSLATFADHGHAPDEICSDCLALLTEAAELATADFMAGFTLRDTIEFDDWHYFEAEALHRAVASILERLALAYGAIQDYERATGYARRWVALDPLHEPAQKVLMSLYQKAGYESAALRQYELYTNLLNEEFGQPPGDEIAGLYDSIKTGRLQNGASGTASGDHAGMSVPTAESSSYPSPPAAEPARHHLPIQVTPFVGRQQDLVDVGGLLRQQGHRLVTLMGPGGIGKTRLSLALAESVKGNFADGAHFVALAPLQTADDIIPAVIEALDVRFYDQAEPRVQLLNYLSTRQMLLVLDNFEHLIAGVDEVDAMLRAAPGLKILATSRERLNLSGETVRVLGGMAYPGLMIGKTSAHSTKSGSTFADYSAVRLLMQQARLVRPGLARDEAFLENAARICRLVQGMPLAIVLAAGWLELLSLSEIADEIAGSLDFLETEMRDVPDRQRSMRAVFDKSWDRLSPTEQAIFMQLSVFRGDFARGAAETVAGANLRALRGLVNKSFVIFNRRDRFEVHELLRQYGQEVLVASGSETSIRLAHSMHYLNFVQRCEADLRGRAQLEALRSIEAEYENIRGAWTWALAHRYETTVGYQSQDAANSSIDNAIRNAAEALHLYFDMNGLYRAGVAFFRSSYDALVAGRGSAPAAPPSGKDAQRDSVSDRTMGKILVRLRFLQSITDDVAAEWETDLRTCQKIAEASADWQEFAICTTVSGIYHFTSNSDPSACLLLLEQVAQQFESLGDKFYQARIFSWIALCHRTLSNPAKNEHYFRKELALAREIGEVAGASTALYNLAEVALIAGRYDEVVVNCAEAAESGRGLAQPFSQCLLSFGYLLRGELDGAQRGLQQTRALYRTSHSVDLSILMAAVGSVWAALSGANEESERQAQFCLDSPGADPLYVTMANWGLALSRCDLGDVSRTRHYLTEAFIPALDLDSSAMQCWLLPVAAVISAHENRKEQALELLALAAGHPLSPNGWHAVWPPLPALRATLEADFEPEYYERLWARGQSLELEVVVKDWLDAGGK